MSEQVDRYLEDLPPERRAALKQLRVLIRETVPDAKETMAYGMPAYAGEGVFCTYASQKHYMSLYFMDTRIVDRHQAELAGLNPGKSCVRFRRFADLPRETIVRMLREAAEGPVHSGSH